MTVSLPEPPDGPPLIGCVTGKTVSLSWKGPKNLDPSMGKFVCLFLNYAGMIVPVMFV